MPKIFSPSGQKFLLVNFCSTNCQLRLLSLLLLSLLRPLRSLTYSTQLCEIHDVGLWQVYDFFSMKEKERWKTTWKRENSWCCMLRFIIFHCPAIKQIFTAGSNVILLIHRFPCSLMSGDCMQQFHVHVCEAIISICNWWEFEEFKTTCNTSRRVSPCEKFQNVSMC